MTTERLQLRPVTIEDLAQIHALHLLPATDKYNTQGIPKTIDDTRVIVTAWLSEQHETPAKRHTFFIENNEGEFVGLIGLKVGREKYREAELWYKLHQLQWDKGYATEAVNAILGFCFNGLRLHRLEAGCAAKNTASGKVLLKAGFTHEGTTRKKLPIRGEWQDGQDYAILEEDYQKNL